MRFFVWIFVILALAALLMGPVGAVEAQRPTPTPPPPTWTPGPAPTKTPTPAPPTPTPAATPAATPSSTLGLRVRGATEGMVAVVQWQDAAGQWHDVSGWQAALHPDAAGNATVNWGYPATMAGQGPFRFALYAEGQLVAAGDPFTLGGDRWTTITLQPLLPITGGTVLPLLLPLLLLTGAAAFAALSRRLRRL